jgi:hypothetical protein
MGEKIVVGPYNKGLRNDRPPFMIDNDSFPTLTNAYQWRGRIKRKRGTSFLARLQRFFNSAISSYNSGTTTITLDGSGNGNLLFNTSWMLETNSNLVPGTITLTGPGGPFTDPTEDGFLTPTGTGGPNTINYTTGAIHIPAQAGQSYTVAFYYYPSLPVMGLEDFILPTQLYPGTIGFDTKYSYNFLTASPYSTYSVSFYKNPPTGSFPGYVAKSTPTPTTWNGQNYQQFWTTNYQGALWATNGITDPFVTTNVGMQFQKPASATWINATTVSFVIAASPLVIGDFVFTSEWSSLAAVTPPNSTFFNFLTGYVTNVVGTTYTVVFPNASIPNDTYSNGILQYLTNRSDVTRDCIRWYDGDPTNGSISNPTLTGTLGWVNFAPPLSNGNFSISDLPAAQYYLVGATLIYQFKDRLIFFGPIIQTSSANSQVYLKDTIIYSQNGTPYYTSTFTKDPSLSNTVFFPVLVPLNQTATAPAYWGNQTGFGGFISAAIDQAIVSLGINEDVLIVQFSKSMARLIYSGNDIVPFNFFAINAEWGTLGTFSSVTMDQGVISAGTRGFVITGQTSSQRIDLEIPDNAFEIGLQNNGAQRICSQRDFINEWIYFTYVPDIEDDEAVTSDIFPSQTLQYNYRDNSWALFNESFTTYGTFRKATGYTWATVGNFFATWNDWTEPWNAGVFSQVQPQVIGGDSQGFVLFRDQGINEGTSLNILNISSPVNITGATQANPAVLTANNSFVVGQQITITGVVGMTQLNGNTFTITAITPTTISLNVDSTAFTPYISGGVATPIGTVYSPGHSLDLGDYIIISGCLGTVSSQVNEKIFSVDVITNDYFNLNPPITQGLTYLGGGLITRMYVPFIQTKQFPTAWGDARKTRLGPQQYLLTTTNASQVSLLIFLSQDAATAYNYIGFPITPDGIVPSPSTNNSLVYSAILFTCPESTNLGLTPANTNLQMLTASSQAQTWHRMNTSLIGDTVQIGISLNDQQMRSLDNVGATLTITGATQTNPCVLTVAGGPAINELCFITGVVGMFQLNSNPSANAFQYFNIIASTSTHITIDVDATGFGAYVSGGQLQVVEPQNQFAEIELLGMILDVQPSQMLA